LSDAGRWRDATAVAREAVAAAGAITHEPTRAAAAFLLGEALEGDGAAPESEQALRDAFAAAERGRDDLLAARVATELVFVVGQLQSRYDDGLDWVFHAETQLRRAGGDPEIEARLLGNQAHIRYGKAEYSAARALYNKAYEMRAKLHGAESLVAAKALHNVARAAMAEGDNAGAIELTRRALALIEQRIGSEHPDLANALSGLGTIELNQGKYADALATIDRALAIAEPSLGTDHPMVGQLAIVRGVALEQLGRAADAAASYTRARDLFARDGRDKRLLAESLSGLGHAQSLLGDRVAARASFVRALEIRKETLGPETEAVAGSLEDLAGLDAELGHHADALSGYRSALAIREKVNGPDYFELAYAHAGIGKAEYALGHTEAAVSSLRRAVQLLAGYDGDPESLADMRVALAKAERRTR
ncbi:MAG: tetratricopeptide repeat protein, partial [Kofleriaceae bacterium]|nr:tetratricopeptide repeat protein [Kofleriaceae bacterium]